MPRHSWRLFESWTCKELFWLWYCYLPYLTNRINLFWFSLQQGSWWRLHKGGANLSKYGHAFNLVCLKFLDSPGQVNPSNDSGEPLSRTCYSHWRLVFFFKEIIFIWNSHDSKCNLQKSQALKKKQNTLNRPVEREWPLPSVWQVY